MTLDKASDMQQRRSINERNAWETHDRDLSWKSNWIWWQTPVSQRNMHKTKAWYISWQTRGRCATITRRSMWQAHDKRVRGTWQSDAIARPDHAQDVWQTQDNQSDDDKRCHTQGTIKKEQTNGKAIEGIPAKNWVAYIYGCFDAQISGTPQALTITGSSLEL